MTSQELYCRAKAVKLADSINKIEGVPVSPAAKLLAARWAKGEMTGVEMKAALIAIHRQPQKGSL